MHFILTLPEPFRLALAFVLLLLLPAGFLALCAPAVRMTPAPAPHARLLGSFLVGLPLCLLIWLALRQSLAVLVGSLIGAALLLFLPIILSRIVRHRSGQILPPLPASVRLAAALFVPLFFLYAGVVADLLHVHFPHIYALP